MIVETITASVVKDGLGERFVELMKTKFGNVNLMEKTDSTRVESRRVELMIMELVIAESKIVELVSVYACHKQLVVFALGWVERQ